MEAGAFDLFASTAGVCVVDENAIRPVAGAALRRRFVILQKRNEGLTIIRQFEPDHDFDRFDT